MYTKILPVVLFFLLVSCNMPMPQVPVTQPPQPEVEIASSGSDADAIGTAVELTAAAKFTEIASSVTATPTTMPTPTFTLTPDAPTACNPLVTANVNANVRSGPDTVYDVVGSLSQGQTAAIAGRNDANTWWNIEYPLGTGRYAWVAGSVVIASCVPAAVQVVAAPPSPTATEVEVAVNPPANNSNSNPGNSLLPLKPLPLLLILPDLSAAYMDVPDKVIQGASIPVKVKVKNIGTGDAGSFTVQWLVNSNVGCSWPVASLGAGNAMTLDCSYTMTADPGNAPVQLVVDSGGAVAESNESNNTAQQSVKVLKLLFVPDLDIQIPKP